MFIGNRIGIPRSSALSGGGQSLRDQALASLFGASEVGAMWAPYDLSTTYSDIAGSIPAVDAGPIGYVEDLSGNGVHLTADSTSERPTSTFLDGLRYAYHDGVNHKLDGSIDLPFSGDLFIAGVFRTAAGVGTSGVSPGLCLSASGVDFQCLLVNDGSDRVRHVTRNSAEGYGFSNGILSDSFAQDTAHSMGAKHVSDGTVIGYLNGAVALSSTHTITGPTSTLGTPNTGNRANSVSADPFYIAAGIMCYGPTDEQVSLIFSWLDEVAGMGKP